jgi:8-oxo-dGTP diphosphatase
MAEGSFNIRVYGLLINEQQEVLVSDEFIRGQYITKFPGGGLEFGEGTIDCLIREFNEEMGAAIEVTEHFYTTDFFQESAFAPNDQIISIYYFVKLLSPIQKPIKTVAFDFEIEEHGAEALRWIPLATITTTSVTLPIDKKAVSLLLNKK